MTENDLLENTVGTKNLKSEKIINNEVSNKLLFEPENNSNGQASCDCDEIDLDQV